MLYKSIIVVVKTLLQQFNFTVVCLILALAYEVVFYMFLTTDTERQIKSYEWITFKTSLRQDVKG